MDVSDFYSFSFAGSEKPGFEISNGENEQLAKAKCEKKVMFAPGKDSVDFGGMRNSHFLYTPIRMVGEGAYGYVMLSSVRENQGDKVAQKSVQHEAAVLEEVEKGGLPVSTCREIQLLQKLQHDNVIHLREVVGSEAPKPDPKKKSKPHIKSTGGMYLILDFMEHDLEGLQKKVPLDLAVVKSLTRQLLLGVGYCHSQGVIHRDLRPSNLLINNKAVLKIADFGSARKDNHADDGTYSSKVIGIPYRPLELVLGADKYGPEVDMWSVGCILTELLLGRPLFSSKTEIDLVDKISSLLGAPTEETMPGCTLLSGYANLVKPASYTHGNRIKELLGPLIALRHPLVDDSVLDLLEVLLCLNPKARISANEAVQHIWFQADPKPLNPFEIDTANWGSGANKLSMRNAKPLKQLAQQPIEAMHPLFGNRPGQAKPAKQGQMAPLPGQNGPLQAVAHPAGQNAPQQAGQNGAPRGVKRGREQGWVDPSLRALKNFRRYGYAPPRAPQEAYPPVAYPPGPYPVPTASANAGGWTWIFDPSSGTYRKGQIVFAGQNAGALPKPIVLQPPGAPPAGAPAPAAANRGGDAAAQPGGAAVRVPGGLAVGPHGGPRGHVIGRGRGGGRGRVPAAAAAPAPAAVPEPAPADEDDDFDVFGAMMNPAVPQNVALMMEVMQNMIDADEEEEGVEEDPGDVPAPVAAANEGVRVVPGADDDGEQPPEEAAPAAPARLGPAASRRLRRQRLAAAAHFLLQQQGGLL